MSLILSKKIYDIKEIPKKTGIYFFLDINGIPIYIGKSLNLYKRVNQHINSKSTKSSKLKSRFDHIRYLETKSELIALLIESQEIKRNNPVLNRKLRKKRENIKINKGFGFVKSHSSYVAILNNWFTNPNNTAGYIYVVRDPRDRLISDTLYSGGFNAIPESHLQENKKYKSKEKNKK